MDALMLTDAVRFSHILAVTIGLGGAFLADAYVFSRLKQPISTGFVDMLKEHHKLVAYALLAMWISGTIMIYIRTGFVLENFTPKLYSKIGTVTVLTLNAILIGKIAMPLLVKNIGRSPLDLPLKQKIGVALMSGVSTTSWLLALAMGISKVLAASPWHTFFIVLPIAYGLAVLSSVISIFLIDGIRMMAQYYQSKRADAHEHCSCGAHRRERDILEQLTSLRNELMTRQAGQKIAEEALPLTFPARIRSAS